jgi:pimeloyl-ACP methyl ester carboxylesterase
MLKGIGIEKCVVKAVSAGGPTAYNFALRHPEICKGLIADAAISGNHSYGDDKEAEHKGLMSKMMLTNAFMTRVGQAAAAGNPRSGYAEMLPGIANYDKEETEKYLNFAATDPACIEMLPKMYMTGTGICVYSEGWKAFEKEF